MKYSQQILHQPNFLLIISDYTASTSVSDPEVTNILWQLELTNEFHRSSEVQHRHTVYLWEKNSST